MIIFEDLEKLTHHFQKISNSPGIKVVSVDGKDGSGKSTLAEQISETADCIHMNLDSDRYFDKNKGGYVKHLKYQMIKSDLDDLLSKPKIIIFDGVCNLKILQKLDLSADLKIYVKKLLYGIWEYGEKTDYSQNVENVITEQLNNLRSFAEVAARVEGKEADSSKISLVSLSKEILRYHFEYKPDLSADIVFEREYSRSQF